MGTKKAQGGWVPTTPPPMGGRGGDPTTPSFAPKFRKASISDPKRVFRRSSRGGYSRPPPLGLDGGVRNTPSPPSVPVKPCMSECHEVFAPLPKWPLFPIYMPWHTMAWTGFKLLSDRGLFPNLCDQIPYLAAGQQCGPLAVPAKAPPREKDSWQCKMPINWNNPNSFRRHLSTRFTSSTHTHYTCVL